jgi:cell division protease FtsH
MRDFEDAKDKVMLGVERKSLVLSEEEKRLTAYHEAGHAIVSLRVPGVDPVHKVSIVPRGRSLGLTFWLPEEDRHNYTKEYIVGRLAMSYGGRVAEELIFGLSKVTTGAAQDIQQATELARRMVTQFGMSDVIGPIAVGDREQQIFLGREIAQRHEVSEKTAELVDAEIKRVLDEALNRARTILESEMTLLHKMAAALLDRETLDREEVEALAAGKEMPPRAPLPPVVPAPRSEKERTPAPDRKPVLGTPPPEPAGA